MFHNVLDILSTQYRAIESLIARTEALLDHDNPDFDGLARLHWEQTRALRECQLLKQLRLFMPAAGDDAAIIALAARLHAECATAGEAFRAHIVRWNGHVSGDDWPLYRIAARDMMSRVRQHIAAERRAIELLLQMRAACSSKAVVQPINRNSGY